MVSEHDEAFVEFVAAHQDRLRRIAYAVCADPTRAEDVLQEALVKVYVSWARVARSGNELAYARRVVVNADVDDRRRPWRRKRAEVSETFLHELPARSPFPVEERSALLDAVRSLPAMQRKAVVLRHWVGLSVADVADDLGISQGTVKSHTARGLATLQARLVKVHDGAAPD